MKDIFFTLEGSGWVLYPQVKRLFSLAGREVPQFFLASKAEKHYGLLEGSVILSSVKSSLPQTFRVRTLTEIEKTD